MKAVLISIRQKWCELIATGKKTVEVRKTRPKLETPFKCYIYKTGGGGVIGEFVCDTFVKDLSFGHNPLLNGAACLSEEEASKYADGKVVYGWHISELKIYDEPKELKEFSTGSSTRTISEDGKLIWRGMKRPPQSWCYVDLVQEEN